MLRLLFIRLCTYCRRGASTHPEPFLLCICHTSRPRSYDSFDKMAHTLQQTVAWQGSKGPWFNSKSRTLSWEARRIEPLPRLAKKSPVNFGPITTGFWMCILTHPNQLFRKTIFWPLAGAAGSIFFTRAREWPRLASEYAVGDGGRPQQFLATNI